MSQRKPSKTPWRELTLASSCMWSRQLREVLPTWCYVPAKETKDGFVYRSPIYGMDLNDLLWIAFNQAQEVEPMITAGGRQEPLSRTMLRCLTVLLERSDAEITAELTVRLLEGDKPEIRHSFFAPPKTRIPQ